MHGPLTPSDISRLRRLPFIARAREHRLYAIDGSRWTDCWLDGGRALLGHRPGGMSRRVKNELDRGLYAPYPSRWELRLETALMKLFPGYQGVRLYRSSGAALKALGPYIVPVDPLDLPAEGPGKTAGALWGRPQLPGHPEADFLLPILPVSGISDVQPLLFSEGKEPELPSDIISPLLLAALTRSCISGSDRADSSELASSEEDKTGIPLKSTRSTDIWERRGPYMLFRGNDDEYDAVFTRLIAAKVLIAPSRIRPSIFLSSLNEKEAALILAGGKTS